MHRSVLYYPMVVQKRGILLGFLLQTPVDGITMVTLNSEELTLGIQGILYLCIFVLVAMEKCSYYICMTSTCKVQQLQLVAGMDI